MYGLFSDKVHEDGTVQVEMDILYTPEQWAMLDR